MYITRVEIQNIRSIRHLVWEIDAADAAGWHVILGDNGSGKSTFVRAIALSLVEATSLVALNQEWNTWSRVPLTALSADNKNAPSIQLQINLDNKDDMTYLSSSSLKIETPFIVGIGQVPEDRDLLPGRKYASDEKFLDSRFFVRRKTHGWFSASYGPLRRFTGGDQEDEKLFRTNLNIARHLSAFSESVSLIEGTQWLKNLQFQRLEGDKTSALLLDLIIEFVNQPDFLPNGVTLDQIHSTGVRFVDGNGSSILVENLSDGYRSVLSMTFELLRQLSLTYGSDIFEEHPDGAITVKVPGVVQIDEVDAHLHPTWQKQIGFWLTKHFPKIQFIVTTHSPLVCQAAERGSIYRLPTPGTEETGQMLTGQDRDRLLYGNILDAYSTEAFGSGITRSPKSEEMLDRLGALNIKEITEGLTDAETAEQERLRATLPSTASTLPDGQPA